MSEEYLSEHSPEPGVPQTGTKAYIATLISFVVSFAGMWVVDTEPFTNKELVSALIASAVVCGLTGGGTYVTKNWKKVK